MAIENVDALVPPLTDNFALIEIISEILEQSHVEICEAMIDEEKLLGTSQIREN